jgi:catechol 2,3-dioxygenase
VNVSDDSLQLRLAHATVPARDLARMVTFYTEVLGFHVTNRGAPMPGMGEMVFISQTPDEHHQIVLVEVTDPAARGFVMADHLAFRTTSLDQVRALADRLVADGNTSAIPISHGNAWSLYFTDPEGNGLEVFIDSPFHVAQPYADRLDLSKSDDDIEATTRSKIEGLPEFQSFDAWRQAMAARLGAKG